MPKTLTMTTGTHMIELSSVMSMYRSGVNAIDTHETLRILVMDWCKCRFPAYTPSTIDIENIAAGIAMYLCDTPIKLGREITLDALRVGSTTQIDYSEFARLYSQDIMFHALGRCEECVSLRNIDWLVISMSYRYRHCVYSGGDVFFMSHIIKLCELAKLIVGRHFSEQAMAYRLVSVLALNDFNVLQQNSHPHGG